MKIRTLVVDGDGATRSRVGEILESIEGFELIGTVASWDEALETIDVQQPDLVLVSPDGARDDLAFTRHLDTGRTAMVLMADGPELAVPAFEAGAVDYVMKPFTDERLRQAVSRAGDWIVCRASRNGSAQLTAALERIVSPSHRTRFVARADGKLFVVRAEDINWATPSQSNLVELHAQGGVYTLRTTLSALEEMLDPSRFLRVHRSHIVNIDRVVRVETWGARELLLFLACGGKILTGRTYAERVYQVFGL